jgi:hypothetical protein
MPRKGTKSSSGLRRGAPQRSFVIVIVTYSARWLDPDVDAVDIAGDVSDSTADVGDAAAVGDEMVDTCASRSLSACQSLCAVALSPPGSPPTLLRRGRALCSLGDVRRRSRTTATSMETTPAVVNLPALLRTQRGSGSGDVT